MDIILVPLERIKNHNVFKKPELVEQFVASEFMLRDAAQLITPQIIPHLLQLHPIHVLPAKNGDYLCVGGLRTLTIVRQLLPPSDKIAVIPLEKMRDEEILEKCLVDILLATSCFSLSSKESVYRTLKFFQENIRDGLLVTKFGPSRIARILQVNVETVRLWSKRLSKARSTVK